MRATAPRDRAWAGTRTVRVVGPVDGLTADVVRRRLLQLRATDPAAPWWREYRPGAATWVVAAPAATAASVLAVPRGGHDVTEVARRLWDETREASAALRVWVCDEHLLVSVSHVASDGHGVLRLIGRLLSDGPAADGAPAARAPLARVLTRALLRRTVHPAEVRVERLAGPRPAAVAERRAGPQPPDVRPVAVSASSSPAPVQVAVSCGVLDAEQVARWRRHRDAVHPGASMATVLLQAAQDELARRGRTSSPDARVLVDCRRYLPPGTEASGNFATGLWMRGDLADPSVLSRSIQRSVASGRPLLTLARASLRAATAPPAAAGPAAGTLLWTLSAVGRTPALDGLAWRSGSPRHYAVLSPPATAGSVVLALAEGADGLWFSLSYAPSTLSPALMDDVCADLAGRHRTAVCAA